jgi:hypothetical protein
MNADRCRGVTCRGCRVGERRACSFQHVEDASTA